MTCLCVGGGAPPAVNDIPIIFLRILLKFFRHKVWAPVWMGGT